MGNNPITVTSPLLPDLSEFHSLLQEIWDSKWITNNGSFHHRLEEALADYLDVPYVSLFTNGTLPLITALQALHISGEVITTPYSFVATTHALWWNGIKPVFVDIDPATGNIDPNRIESAITSRTTAIMPVHVYGKPCDVDAIQQIADKYGLKVIYDAAHAFGVKIQPLPQPLSSREGSSISSPKMGGPRGAKGPREAWATGSENYNILKDHSLNMRKKPTEAENVLWQTLRNNRLGTKFRRQHIIMDYIVDFVSLEHSLIIEVDGGYHNTPEQQQADAIREEALTDKGFRIIRFTNDEVLFDIDHTIERIRANLTAPLLPPHRGDGGGQGEEGGCSLLSYGDLSTLSFHATKVFNTIEGGAMIMHDEKTKQRIDYLKNFGFANETTVVAPGINSKMDEIRAAYGLLNLRKVDQAIEARHQVAIRYRQALRGIDGITFFDDMPGVRHNYSYFPIFVDAQQYGITRDELYFKMREQGVLGRRYFYPLISEFATYRGLESAHPENLPNAHQMANSVICLPMHHALSNDDIQRVINCIVK